MGVPWLSWPTMNHGDPLISPLMVISHANFHGLLGIEHTRKILVRWHTRFGTPFGAPG